MQFWAFHHLQLHPSNLFLGFRHDYFPEPEAAVAEEWWLRKTNNDENVPDFSFSASLSLLFFRPRCYWKLKMWSMILTHGVLVGCFCKVCWVHNYRFVLSLCFQTSNNCWACIKTGKFLFKCLWMNLPNEKSQKTTSDTITSTLEKKKKYHLY